MQAVKKQHKEVMKSVQFFSGRISDFEIVIKQINSRMDNMEKITKENALLKKGVQSLSDRIEALEQQARSKIQKSKGFRKKSTRIYYLPLKKLGKISSVQLLTLISTIFP
ncbi:hypothetical protein JTB14_017749 [Gonioctena quinquepunctata]|nr:hypothetical protein JTB14_017749 [Gonioctena quinquepunctata]